MKKTMILAYSIVAYLCFLAAFLYAIGFVGNVVVPKSMDLPDPGAPLGKALLIDALLLALFAVQHSGMARRGFKERWTRVVSPAIERSTFVLCASGALAILYAFWVPIGAPVWATDDPAVTAALAAVSVVGWLIVLVATFHIDHFELFGLRQGLAAARGRPMPAPRFVTPGLYRVVRHPIYLGFVIAFWATPVMTAGHLVFAIATTLYILVAIRLEERDLVHAHGADYRRYRDEVRMLAPVPRRSSPPARAKMHP